MSAPTPEELAEVTANHLLFLEQWSLGLPRVNDVDVVRAVTYELIQLMNHAYLKARLEHLVEAQYE